MGILHGAHGVSLLLWLLAGCGGVDEHVDHRDAPPTIDAPPTVDAPTDAALDAPVDAAIDARLTELTVRTYGNWPNGGAPRPMNPTWLAVQDGDGPWSIVPGVGGVHRVTIDDPRGRYGVAVWCGQLTTLHALLVEGDDLSFSCRNVPGDVTRPMQLAVANPGPCSVNTFYPNAYWTGLACGQPAVTEQVNPGPHDLIALAWFGQQPRAYVARDVDAPAWTIDLFDPQRSRPAVTHQLTAAANHHADAWVHTASSRLFLQGGMGSVPYASVPDALLDGAARHELVASRWTPFGSDWVETRVLLGGAGDVDFTTTPEPPLPQVTVDAASVEWQPYPGAVGYQLRLAWLFFEVSAGWLDGATRFDYARACTIPGLPDSTCRDSYQGHYSFTAYRAALGSPARFPAMVTSEQYGGSPLFAAPGLAYQRATIVR